MEAPLNNRDWKEDALTVFIPFCEEQIGYHQDNIRKLKKFSWSLIVLGVGLTILAFIIFRNDTRQISDNFFKLGPMLVLAPIPTFQYRMILASRQSVSSYLTWKRRFQSCVEKDVAPPEWLTSAVIKNMDELAKPR